MLTEEQIVDACILSVIGGAVFVKTSTGFGGGGATLEHVSIMKAGFVFLKINATVVGNQALVKASGGIRSFEDAAALIRVGAGRIGTSSGIAILKGEKSSTSY